MQQLPLTLRLPTYSVFANYIPGPNGPALAALCPATTVQQIPMVYLYGPQGVGKTHLLQAACAEAGVQRQAAYYVPLKELRDHSDVLAGCERMAMVCLDDCSHVAGNLIWERALLSLYLGIVEMGGRLILADTLPPRGLSWVLPDWASRLLASNIVRLHPLTEAQQIEALCLRATQRGLTLPEETIAYLMRRMPRDMTKLCAFLDKLDKASLVAQRKLTVPFVRQVLRGNEAP